MTATAGRPGSRRFAWLSGAALAGALFLVVLRLGDLERAAQMAREAKPLWLLAAVALQIGTYASVAMGWAVVLERAGSPRRIGTLMPLAVAKLFADQVVPTAGIGGNLLLVDRLVASGVPRSSAVAALLVSVIGYYAAYAALALVMLLVLWVHRAATPLLVGLVTSFLLVALAIPVLALWLRARGSKPLPRWIEQVPPLRTLLSVIGEAPKALVADRGLLVRVAGCSALVFLADAATLAVCLHAAGQPLTPAAAFIAFMIASIVVTLGPVPMGLGTFEASCTATLTMLGVPIEAALAATILTRGFTLWLPMIPGLLFFRSQVPARRR